LTSSQIQAALDLKQPFTRETYESPIYTPARVKHIYRLERLAQMEQQGEIVKFRLIHIANGSLALRHWDQKRTYDSLDNVLKGGLFRWRLASYGICKDGLILKFLPRHNPELMAEAQEYLDQIDTGFIPGAQNQRKQPAHLNSKRRQQLIEEFQDRLYQKYAVTIVADGKFQARFTVGTDDYDIFACGRTAVALYSLRHNFRYNDFRKITKVTYPRQNGPAIILHYQ